MNELLELFARGSSCDVDVLEDILRYGRLAAEFADDTHANLCQSDATGAGLTKQVV